MSLPASPSPSPNPAAFWDSRFGEPGFAYGDQPTEVHARAVTALRPGGHLILEAYTPRQLLHRTGGPASAELLIEPAALRQELAGLELLLLEEQERWIEEGPYHHGQSAVVRVLGRKRDGNEAPVATQGVMRLRS